MWTRFMDMHSGGRCKEGKYEYIYIEAPIHEAKLVFYNRFGHNPERVTCTCCGEDYSISEDTSLAQLTGYDRNCAYVGKKYVEKHDKDYGGAYQTLAEYKKQKNVLVIPKDQIKAEERKGELPRQGYVWMD